MNVKDSGKVRKFGTGAHRDATEGKGRCDLLPLVEIADLLGGDDVLKALGAFIKKPEEKYIFQAIKAALKTVKEFNNSELTLILEASMQYEDGANKYGENNWKFGMPLKVYIDSGVRHYIKTLRGDTDEPHWRAFAWNMLCALWTMRNQPDAVKNFGVPQSNGSAEGLQDSGDEA